MSTALANPVEMIRQGAPHLIRSDAELEQYTSALSAMTCKPKPTRVESEAIALLTVLIDHYESQQFEIPNASPLDVLHYLLRTNGLAQRDIAAELGSESTVSLVLSGKRRLTRQHIARRSRRFGVEPSVFFE